MSSRCNANPNPRTIAQTTKVYINNLLYKTLCKLHIFSLFFTLCISQIYYTQRFIFENHYRSLAQYLIGYSTELKASDWLTPCGSGSPIRTSSPLEIVFHKAFVIYHCIFTLQCLIAASILTVVSWAVFQSFSITPCSVSPRVYEVTICPAARQGLNKINVWQDFKFKTKPNTNSNSSFTYL